MKYCVYKITNKINNKIYVGFHKTDNLDDNYMGSGTLIIKAIKKYGKENFIKEILAVFDNKEDAEQYEADIVNKEFTLREDTYNIVIGGNVRIAYGENNGFYNKKHSEETLQKSSERMLGNNYSKRNIYLIDDVEYTLKEVIEKLCLNKNIRLTLIKLCGDPNTNIRFKCEKTQLEAEEYYIDLIERIKNKKEKLAQLAKERFTGYTFSEERNKKLSAALTGKKRDREIVDRINKNPEKIRKTAEKHRGMKRSEEAKKKMSLAKLGKPSNNKGKILIKDEFGKTKLWPKNEQIPDGFKRKINKCAINILDNTRKMFDIDFPLPENWKWLHHE